MSTSTRPSRRKGHLSGLLPRRSGGSARGLPAQLRGAPVPTLFFLYLFFVFIFCICFLYLFFVFVFVFILLVFVFVFVFCFCFCICICICICFSVFVFVFTFCLYLFFVFVFVFVLLPSNMLLCFKHVEQTSARAFTKQGRRRVDAARSKQHCLRRPASTHCG